MPLPVPHPKTISGAAVAAVVARAAPAARVDGSPDDSGVALLGRLVRDRVLDRVAARAAVLAAAGEFDHRDLKQLMPAPAVAPRRSPPPTAAESGRPEYLRPGTTVGRCDLGRALHRGPHGAVYAAVHRDLGLPVVVKAAAPGPPAEQLAVEAGVLARLTHPNVVRLWDAGRHGDTPFLVLERLGPSLRAVAAGGPLRPDRAFRFARQAARGLRAAHRAGYTHGDVKPGNLLLGHGRVVRVADFGLARRVGGPDPAADRVAGSWPYMAPERFAGAGDHRADVYALGLTIYQLLSGRPPVVGDTAAACYAAHRALALEPLHWWLPGVSRAASAVVLRMTARDPDRRHADYDTLLSDLTRAARPVPAAPPRTRS